MKVPTRGSPPSAYLESAFAINGASGGRALLLHRVKNRALGTVIDQRLDVLHERVAALEHRVELGSREVFA